MKVVIFTYIATVTTAFKSQITLDKRAIPFNYSHFCSRIVKINVPDQGNECNAFHVVLSFPSPFNLFILGVNYSHFLK